MDFVEWIKSEMDSRNWKQADFARASKISTAQVARVLTRQQGASGNSFIEGVARAFKLPIESVYQKAGILPSSNTKSPKQSELAHIAGELPEADVDDLIELARIRLRRKERTNGAKQSNQSA